MNKFTGLVCPVFTPFTPDKRGISWDVIEKYCVYLKTKGVQCVLVNGITGEGTCLRIDERKRLAEEWLKVCRKHSITMMLCIGGCDVADVCDLCDHAEKIGVDCVVIMPDLFYKPKVEEDLVSYMNIICKYCPKLPLYYYHIPQYTDVKLCMTRCWELLTKAIPNFRGCLWGGDDITTAHNLLKDGCHIIMCHDTLLTGCKMLGFETFCCVTMNIWPERVKEIYDFMCTNKFREAYNTHTKLCDDIRGLLRNQTCDFVEVFKLHCNKVCDINLGGVRKPQCTWYKRF